MRLFKLKTYIDSLTRHYEIFFGLHGKYFKLEKDSKENLDHDFFILEFPPNNKHNMFCYCTAGMSFKRNDDNLIELIIYSAKPDKTLIELLTICALYHRNGNPLNLHHTVNIGQPWQDNSKCDHGFISLPYLDGAQLEIFKFKERETHCYWFIPITKKERDYKSNNGFEALEKLFENKQFNYLNPNRDCLIS